MAVTIVFQILIGGLLLVFGWWGRTHVDRLCPAGIPEDERDRRRRVIVRGAWACQVAGVVFVLMIIPLFL